MPEYADWMDQDELRQACVEYVADYYASMGLLWNPWEERMQSI